MKLIRSSSWSCGFFCLSTPPILLEYFNVQSDLSSFLSNSLQLLFSFSSFNFVLSFLVWSIDALQQVARAYNMAVSFCHLIWCFIFPSHLMFHFPVSSDVSFSRLFWCFIFPSHLLFHFPVPSDVSLPVLCRMQRAKWEKKNVTCWFSSRKLVHSREKP